MYDVSSSDMSSDVVRRLDIHQQTAIVPPNEWEKLFHI